MKAFFSVPFSYLASLSVNAAPDTTTIAMGFIFAVCLTKELSRKKPVKDGSHTTEDYEDSRMREISQALAKEAA